MKNSPKISIIASTYNSNLYINKWLVSIEKQDVWNEAELIIIPNDPSDEELFYLNNFAKKYPNQVYIKVVSREPLYASWNRAILMAASTIYAISNVDDIRKPSSLSTQVRLLENNLEANFCYGPFEVVTKFECETGVLVIPPAFDREEFSRSMRLGPFFIWRANKDYIKNFFDEQFKSGGDFDFAVRLSLSGYGICANESLGYYLDSGTGLSTSGELQPIERTVIELRYGIWDKVDFKYIPSALEYDLKNVKINNSFIPLHEILPSYHELFEARKKMVLKRESKVQIFLRKLLRFFGF
jgi:glycosyltransferase involved in cell wall biosynthesis